MYSFLSRFLSRLQLFAHWHQLWSEMLPKKHKKKKTKQNKNMHVSYLFSYMLINASENEKDEHKYSVSRLRQV